MEEALRARLLGAMAGSPALSSFCRAVYYEDLGQTGYADMAQVHTLLRHSGLTAGSRVLDMGCGGGRLLRYICAHTGAEGYGQEPDAETAERAGAPGAPARIQYAAARLDTLVYPGGLFDSVYMVDTLALVGASPASLARLLFLLKPGGRLLLLHNTAAGAGPYDEVETALRGLGAPPPYTEGLDEQHREHIALRKRQLKAHKAAFAEEGHTALYKALWADCKATSEAHRRLYVITRKD